VAESDIGESAPSLKRGGDAKSDCFPASANVKRVVLTYAAHMDAVGFDERLSSTDLMGIADPQGLNRLETFARRDLACKFAFPFFTIEDEARVVDTHIMISNDYNLPYFSCRKLDTASDNEFALLEVTEFLAAK
jgi:hypothetical protein